MPRISVWISIAFATMGLLIGATTGLSHTPVVRDLLPLLFGAMGGGAGIFAILRADRSRAIGVGLTLFSLATLGATLQGIVLREGITWKMLWTGRPHAVRAVVPDQARSEPIRYARVVALKLKLQRLDLTDRELQEMTTLAATAPEADLTQIEAIVNGIQGPRLWNADLANQPKPIPDDLSPTAKNRKARTDASLSAAVSDAPNPVR